MQFWCSADVTFSTNTTAAPCTALGEAGTGLLGPLVRAHARGWPPRVSVLLQWHMPPSWCLSSLWLVSHLVHRYVSRTHIHAHTYKAHVLRMITYITLLSALSERSVWTLHSAMLISRVLYFTCVVAELRGRKTDMQNLVLVYNS